MMEAGASPKKNSLLPDEHALAPLSVFADKIRWACASQQDDNPVIIARVEALIAGAGIPEALDRAREKEVEVRANLKSVEEAVRQNEPVVPKSEQQFLIKLQVQLQTLEDELKSFEARYTGAYKSVDQRFEELPHLIKELTLLNP